MDEFHEIVKLPPVLLPREDLLKLEQVLSEGMHSPPGRRTPTFNIDDGPRRVGASSIGELLSKKIPRTTNSFHAELLNWDASDDIDAGVTLTLFHNYGQFQLHAKSESQFLGKKHQILSFFRSHKPWYAILVHVVPIVTPLLTLAAFLAAIAFARRGNIMLASLSSALALGSLLVSVLTFKNRLFPYVRIQLEEKVRVPRREAVVLALTVTGLAATVVGIVLQATSGKSP